MTLIRYTITGIPGKYSTTERRSADRRLVDFQRSYPEARIVVEAVEGRRA